MSYLVLPPAPPEMEVLQNTTPDLIAPAYFKQACYAFGYWQIACGVPADQLQDPEVFVTEADMEHFLIVVSRWPLSVPNNHLRCPTLFEMLHDLKRAGDRAWTFRERLDWRYERVLAWMHANKVDPDNPNETVAERKARLNRARVKAHRQRNAESKSDDPQEQALTDAVRALARSVQAGRTWAKGAEADAKRERDAAIEAAKAHCTATISAAKAAVANEEHRLQIAQGALDAYTSSK